MAQPDDLVQPFRPDRDLLAQVTNRMLDKEGHEHKFMRQRWEHSLGASRVVLDSLREIWPAYHHRLTEEEGREIKSALECAERLVLLLDGLDLAMLGEEVVGVLRGAITEPEDGPIDDSELGDGRPMLTWICEHPGQKPVPESGAPDESTVRALLQGGWVEMQRGTLVPTAKAMDLYGRFASD